MGTDGERVATAAGQPQLQPVPVREQRARIVAVHEAFGVDVADHQIECSVAVEITVRRAARDVGRGQPPGRGLIAEAPGAVVAEGIVGNGGGAHGIDEAHVVHALRARFAFHGGPVGQERHIVLRGDVPGEAVGHVDILAAILIEVREEGAPAPIGLGGARQIAHVAEGAVAVVALQHIAHELVAIPIAHLGHVDIPSFVHGRGFDAILVLRHHVGGVDVRPAVVVHVSDVHAHGEVARQRHGRVQHILEGAVLLIEIEVVALVEVVGHVDVGPPVAIHVADTDPQPERDFGAPDTGALGDVGEGVAVIAIEVVTAVRVPLVARVAHPEAVDRARRVVDHEQVEIAVAIEVDKGGVRGPALVGYPVPARQLHEGGHGVGAETLIDPEGIGARGRLAVAGMAEIDVEPSVAVDVGQGDAGGPWPIGLHAGCRGDVAKAERPFIQEEAGPVLVGREDDLGPTITGQVANGDPATVVEVAVREDVALLRVHHPIGERHARVGRGHEREERAVDRRRISQSGSATFATGGEHECRRADDEGLKRHDRARDERSHVSRGKLP